MEKQALKTCPLCGAKLNLDGEPVGNNELLNELQELKEQGILSQTIFVAVKIIKSMNGNNPAWYKEMLDDQSQHLTNEIQKFLIRETRPIMQEICELKGSPQTMGKAEEIAIVKRLSALKTGQDRFTTDNSTKSGEDVECIVSEEGRELGKMVIESKRTRKWQEQSIEQIKGYMEKESTEFGIVATTVLPDDSLSFANWRNGVLVVKLSYLEPAYLFMREHLKLKRSLEEEYSSKIKQLEIKDQILQELKEAVTSGHLDEIVSRINVSTMDIDSSIARVENMLGRLLKGIKKDTNKIRECTARLVSEHIEKIRGQLIGKLTT